MLRAEGMARGMFLDPGRVDGLLDGPLDGGVRAVVPPHGAAAGGSESWGEGKTYCHRHSVGALGYFSARAFGR